MDIKYASGQQSVSQADSAPQLSSHCRANDIQIEFTMLDPHIRLPLVDEGNGTFSLAFKVPDVYGVFKYVVDYRHLGYSYIEISHQVGKAHYYAKLNPNNVGAKSKTVATHIQMSASVTTVTLISITRSEGSSSA